MKRTSTQAYEAWEQATRQKWRALALVIKAKLEAVESGITTIEQEFLPFIVAADGRTVGEHLIPQLDQYCLSGGNLLLLPPAPKGTEQRKIACHNHHRPYRNRINDCAPMEQS
ncbi:MAG: hypothetical protein U0Y68_23875 [Blastocatellia bacterium]